MIDDTLDALADERRRELLLDLLDDAPQQACVSAQVPPGLEDRERTTRRHTGLYHVHLPKLDAYGLIDWNRETQEIHRGPNFDQARPLLEVVCNSA